MGIGLGVGGGLGGAPSAAAFFARGRAGFVGRVARAGAMVDFRFLAVFFAGRLLVAFFLAGAFDGRLLAAFFVGLDARFLVAAFFVALDARFFVARFFVVRLVAIAPPEASTISESRCVATVSAAQPSTT